MAFEGAEAAIVVQAPDFERLVAASCQYEASARACGSVVTRDRSCLFGGECDGPDAALVATEDALNLAFFR